MGKWWHNATAQASPRHVPYSLLPGTGNLRDVLEVPSPEPQSPKRKSSVWIVVNLVLVGVVAYVLYTREHRVAPPEESSPAPTPETAPETPATPATPVPTPAPLPAATPPPAPTPLPPIALSTVDRRALPRQVTLLKPVDFVLVAQGHPIGSAHAPAGVTVSLVGVVSDSQIEVRMGDSQQTIPAADTDIEARVRILLKFAAPAP